MNPIIEINEVVDVVAVFRHAKSPTAVRLIRMHYHGRNIAFTKLGMCHPVRHGAQLHYVFNVSDGANDYSLDFDTTTLTWTLVAMIDGGAL